MVPHSLATGTPLSADSRSESAAWSRKAGGWPSHSPEGWPRRSSPSSPASDATSNASSQALQIRQTSGPRNRRDCTWTCGSKASSWTRPRSVQSETGSRPSIRASRTTRSFPSFPSSPSSNGGSGNRGCPGSDVLGSSRGSRRSFDGSASERRWPMPPRGRPSRVASSDPWRRPLGLPKPGFASNIDLPKWVLESWTFSERTWRRGPKDYRSGA